MAEYFSRRGAVVVALDYLGISDSSRPPHPQAMDRRVMAAVQHAAADQIFGMAHRGMLAPSLPPLAHIRKVGVAHSMGVMLTITQQAEHGSFDQLGLTGYSVRGVRLTRVAAPLSVPANGPTDYEPVNRRALRPEYYMPDVPADVIAADEAAGAMAPVTISREAMAGRPSSDAGQLTAPIFFALGEHDISPDPHDEAGMFTSCDDLTFFIVAGAAHSLNVAGSRQVLWDRLLAWIPTPQPPAANAS
jgi:hypothetical protein